jgi:TATA-box binding protein (TBP) (component of TFIID and TFIIIB)
LFNSGKIEIPGVQNDEMVEIAVQRLIRLIQPYTEVNVAEVPDKRQTILINSNFSCNYYLNRELLFNILKSKYHIKCSYDPCSYPGIQCKYKLADVDVSFMIFRTGSILIVGKCETPQLYMIYDFIKDILRDEFDVINEENTEVQPKKIKRKIKKMLYVEKVI